MNDQHLDVEKITKDLYQAKRLMIMLDQFLEKNFNILVGTIGDRWCVTAPGFSEKYATAVEAYRAALQLSVDGWDKNAS